MKKQNIWIVGLDERGSPDYADFDFRQDTCLVLGSEGSGLHDLVKRTCDHLSPHPHGRQRQLAERLPSPAQSSCTRPCASAAPRTQPAAPESKPMKPRKGLGS